MRTYAPQKWHNRLEEALANVTSHWLFSRSNMEIQTSKKWYEGFEYPVVDMTSH